MDMTDRQERFAQEYVLDLNATKAAKRAGYSEKSAYSQGARMLKNDEVLARISILQKNAAETAGVTAVSVLTRLNEIADRCMQKKPALQWDAESKSLVETGEWQFDAAGANRALELLGKHLGIFEDRVTVDADADIRVELSGELESFAR